VPGSALTNAAPDLDLLRASRIPSPPKASPTENNTNKRAQPHPNQSFFFIAVALTLYHHYIPLAFSLNVPKTYRLENQCRFFTGGSIHSINFAVKHPSTIAHR
jgi:hypothetical protein